MDNENIKFSWVDTHKKIVKYLLGKKDDQLGLIQLLKKIGVTGFNDKDKDGNNIELAEIDPFTFFRFIYKYGSKKRHELLQKLAKELNIYPLPLGESGLPSSDPRRVRLFPIKSERNNNEINRLWEFFELAVKDQLSDEIFTGIIEIHNTGKTVLTELLFYINPEKYLPLNGPSIKYLEILLFYKYN